MLRILAGVGVVLFSSACSNQPRTEYYCDNSERAGAIYTTRGSESSAMLYYKDRVFSLYSVRSASGAKYATEQGLSEGDGLIWWTQGDTALLLRMINDHSVSADDYPVIASCEAI